MQNSADGASYLSVKLRNTAILMSGDDVFRQIAKSRHSELAVDGSYPQAVFARLLCTRVLDFRHITTCLGI